MHITLIGDSIFDNAPYVNGQPDVIAHLRNMIPEGWKATLRAVDGSTTREISAQMRKVPEDTDLLFLSVGGNDALMHLPVLSEGKQGFEILGYLAGAIHEFAISYRSALDEALNFGKPLTVCTIYNGNLEAYLAQAVQPAIAMFNDTIYQAAGELAVPVIELRRVCTNPEDYANPIEPSVQGGKKIAAAILGRVH